MASHRKDTRNAFHICEHRFTGHARSLSFPILDLPSSALFQLAEKLALTLAGADTPLKVGRSFQKAHRVSLRIN
jgi:hypothetical protein